MIQRVVELYVAEFEPHTPDTIFRRQTPDAMPELDPRALASMAKFDLDDFEERHCEVCRLHTAFLCLTSVHVANRKYVKIA